MEGIRDFWLGLWDNAPAMFWGEYDRTPPRPCLSAPGRAGGNSCRGFTRPLTAFPSRNVDDPVNQIPYLQLYQRNAAVSAHDLQVTLGNDILLSATADDHSTVKNAFIHLIGAAWQRYVEWAAVDPQELIIGGNYDGYAPVAPEPRRPRRHRRGPVRHL